MAISNLSHLPEIEVKVEGYGEYSVPGGTSVNKLIEYLSSEIVYPVVAVKVNNEIKDLNYVLHRSCRVGLIDLSDEAGMRIYRSSAAFLLLKACRDLFPDRNLTVKHSLSNGLFCEFVEGETDTEEAGCIEKRMWELVEADLPIRRFHVSLEEARKIFMNQQQMDKVRLFESRDKDKVHIYELDGLYEYFYGFMVIRTSLINNFKVLCYQGGIILQTPETDDPLHIKPYVEQKKLAGIFREAKEWAEMLGTPHVAALNEIIANGDVNDIIRINEALHEKKVASIADQICKNPSLRLVLISGPSSSGKTTFAQRLLIQLRVNGRRPATISLDNYFVDRDQTPLDEEGNYDFEALAALKLDLFNEHLSRLISGEQVEIPVFNFKKGTTEPKGMLLQVPPEEPIIIEGIHALNDQLTWSIPLEQKFKVYVSALTQLNIDYTNRIPTTDSRLIRRIVRDSRTRGYSALNTLAQWPSVRRGEERNIFPFQETADVMFNTSLVYELAVLKPYAEPLLKEIGAESPEYHEARRLLKFMSYFKTIPTDGIPPNSILREFIGGSWFR